MSVSTRQEILFYTVIAMNPKGITENDIFNGMAFLAEEMGLPVYLNHVPRPLEERLKDQEYYGSHIERCTPRKWIPQSVEKLKAYIGYLVTNYMTEDQYAQARDVIEEKLDLNFSKIAKRDNTRRHLKLGMS